MAERDIIKAIRRAVKAEGGMAIKLHGGMFQCGLPDLVIIHRGVVLWVEVKCPGRHLTPLQRAMMNRMRSHGGHAIVATDVETVVKYLRRFADESSAKGP